MRTLRLLLPVLLVVFSLAAPDSSAASHLRAARVFSGSWESGPEGHTMYFFVEVAFNDFATHQIGFPVLIEFDFGDGTIEPLTLTVTELHTDEGRGWFVASGEFFHLYAPGTLPAEAGIDSCCREAGGYRFDLNNRSFGQFRVKGLVADSTIFNQADWPGPIVWLAGGLGDDLEFQIHTSDHDPLGCRFSTDAEAGGGPNPAGMTIDSETCTIHWTPSGDPEKLWTTQVRVERLDGWGGEAFASGVMDFLIGLDTGRPLCRLERVLAGPPTQLQISVHDPRSGIAGIQVLQSTNATVEIPPFIRDTTRPLTVVAKKIDQSRSARVELRVTDIAGNATQCDPVLTEEIRETGPPETSTYTGIPPEERFVTVSNGDPGLKGLRIEVNGRKFEMSGLRPGEERTLDVGAAVIPGRDSVVSLTPRGKPGGSATVLIWDGNGTEE